MRSVKLGFSIACIVLSCTDSKASTNLPFETIPVSQSTLSIHLEHLSVNAHWAIGIHPSNDQFSKVTAGQVRQLEGVTNDFRGDGSDIPLPDRALKISDSEVVIHADLSGESVFADVTIPSGKSVAVYIDEKLAYTGKPSNSLTLLDGATAPYYGLPFLMGTLAFPSMITEQTGADIRTGTVTEVTAAGLRRHLLSRPPTPTVGIGTLGLPDANGSLRVVMVQITISPTGHVKDATPVGPRGSDPLASAAAASLLKAVFDPFEINGAPATVTGTVSYAIRADESITSSLDK